MTVVPSVPAASTIGRARRADPQLAAKSFRWKDTQDIRDEIERVFPTYNGIASLRKKGDQFQYGGPRLLVDRFLTSDGKGHFSPVELPEERVPKGRFILATRRGKQFNSLIHGKTDPITGAQRDAIFMSSEDVARLGLHDGAEILLRNDQGEFHGHVKLDRIKPGCIQGHWPEVNVLVPAGCLDPSGVPDYNAIVEIIPVRQRDSVVTTAAAGRG